MEENQENFDDMNLRNCANSEIPGPSQSSEFETKGASLKK